MPLIAIHIIIYSLYWIGTAIGLSHQNNWGIIKQRDNL